MASIRFGSFNAHSLVEAGRIAEVERVMSRHKLDICFLQETWLKKKHRQDHAMVGHTLYRTDRAAVRGGTAIAVRRGLAATVIPIQQLANLTVLEATAVMVSLGGGRKLFCLSIYNRTCRNRTSADMHSIFEKLGLDRPEHQYVIGGDFNSLHTQWGNSRTYRAGTELHNLMTRMGPQYGPRVLLSALPSSVRNKSYRDMYIVKDTLDLHPLPDGALNALDLISLSFSDHAMLVLGCRDVCPGTLPVAQEEGRFGRLRRGVASIKGDRFCQLMHKRCDLYGLGVDKVTELAGRNLSADEVNRLTESFTELIVDSMELSMEVRKPKAMPYVPGVIRRLVDEKRDTLRRLFVVYRVGRRDDPVVADHILSLRGEIDRLAGEVKREWQEVRWRQNMAKLDRVRTAQPRDFFQELKRCYQPHSAQANEEETFLFQDTPANRVLLRATEPIELSNGTLLVAGWGCRPGAGQRAGGHI